MKLFKKLGSLLVAAACVCSLVACGSKTADKVIKVGASPTPHALILEAARPLIEAKGYKLEIVEFTDYVLPNTSLQAGELDANYFQHEPYLLDFNANNGTDLVSVGAIRFEPLGIYPGKVTSLSTLPETLTIAIPNDKTNRGRALLLLNQLGLIELSTTEHGFEGTTTADIKDAKGVTIREIEAANIPNILQDVSFGVINGNYALAAKISDKALATEATDSLAATKTANVIAVKRGNEETEKTKVLLEALKSDTVKKYIQDTFGSSVIPVF